MQGAFLHIAPLHRPVRPPDDHSAQDESSAQLLGAPHKHTPLHFPHKPTAAPCKNKLWSGQRPSIVGNRPHLRNQARGKLQAHCFLCSHISYFTDFAPKLILTLNFNKYRVIISNISHSCIQAPSYSLQIQTEGSAVLFQQVFDQISLQTD